MLSPETPYAGYPGSVWQNAFNSLAYYTQQIQSLTTASGASTTSGTALYQTLALLSEATFNTLINGVEAINIYSLYQSWNAESTLLQEIQALPLGLDPTDQAYLNARVIAYENAQAGVFDIIPPVSTFLAPGMLASGIATIPYGGSLEFYEDFTYETPPSGATAATLITDAIGVVTAFQDIANAIIVYQGSALTQLYDVAMRETQCAQSAVNLLNAYTSSTFSDNIGDTNLWNQMVTLPAMTMCAATLSNAPYSIISQQQSVIKYALLAFAQQIAAFIVALRQTPTGQINTTILLQNESLMDVAARTLGNFELWEDIATLNNLSPPYTGAASSSGIAGWGTQLILPSPGTNSASIGTQPSYAANFLGIDLYTGPINGQMPTWTGDFQTIAGYNNLAWALGRRIQTTQGTLIYHPLYGSRIPPEVGQVQTAQTAGHINAFGTSALQSDPRVASVKNATTTLVSGSLIQFTASVQPGGFSGTNVQVNAVLGPV